MRGIPGNDFGPEFLCRLDDGDRGEWGVVNEFPDSEFALNREFAGI